MKVIFAIYKKELKNYYSSLVGYGFMFYFLLVSGVFFTYEGLFGKQIQFSSILTTMTYIFMLAVPFLTMRLFAEERKNKSDQMLLTAPISLFSITMGKYLAAMTVFLLTLAGTVLYPIIMLSYCRPVFSVIFTGYLGFILMGSVFISIGLLISAMAENQVMAAAGTFAALLLLYTIESIIPVINTPWLFTILTWISVVNRMSDFQMGLLSLSPIIYYISFTAVCLFLTIRTIETRRWARG